MVETITEETELILEDEDTEEVTEETGDSEEEEPEGDEQEETPAEPSELESLAAEWGHTPKGQWKGDTEDWIDAKTFIRNERDIRRTVQKTNKDLNRDLRDLQKTTKALQTSFSKFAERHAQSQKSGAERDREQLELEFDEAVSEGDAVKVRAVRKRIDALPEDEDLDFTAESVQEDGSPDTEEPEEVTEWKKVNPWFGTDQAMTQQAAVIDEELRTTYPRMPLKARLKMVISEMGASVSDWQTAQKKQSKRKKAAPVGSGRDPRTSAAQKEGTYTMKDLEKNSALDEMAELQVSYGFFKNKQEYIDSLNEEEGQ